MKQSLSEDLSTNTPSSFSVGTYNILNPFHAVKWRTTEGLDEEGADNWDDHRRAKIIQNLKESQLDIYALQEVSARTYPELQDALASFGYAMTTLYTHFTTEVEGAHGVTVLYRKDRFELLRDQCLQTPSEEYRCATQVDLRNRQTGSTLRIISVHLKGYNPYEEVIEIKRASQQRGDQELSHYLSTTLANHHPVNEMVILGDFNEDADEMFARGNESRQGVLISHGFKWSGTHAPTETRTGRQIDWIFHKDCNTLSLTQLRSQSIAQELSASDHALTGAVCETLNGL